MAQGIPTDPLLSSQWHLGLGAWSINVQDVWLDYTGSGVSVAVMDDGFDYLHPDLSGPYNTSLDFDYANFDSDALFVTSDDTHGTAVMGIIGADDNGQGGVGVAFDSELIGYRIGFSSFSLSTLASALNNAAASADIMNNSWGFTQIFVDNFTNSAWSGVESALINLAQNGRGGLGTVTLFSGGNDRSIGGNSNYHNMTNSQFTIAVAATDQDGTSATTSNGGAAFEYSSEGANLLVSAPGSQIQTTDVRGSTGYSTDDYTNIFGGTSAASPIVAGVVSLMLEANPNLGYRDVQEILAFSARQNDPSNAGWQTNGAGLHFNHEYGFGLVDATAAVRLAETWTIQQTYANRAIATKTEILPVAINDLATSSSTITYNFDYEIEHVLIDVNLMHDFLGDLVIRLISPDQTVSVLMDRPILGLYSATVLDFQFSSVAHWGESSLGAWRLEIEDQSVGDAGFLIDWKISFFGNVPGVDDLYVFTDGRLPTVIDDTDGGVDTLNLAAVTSAINVDLGNLSGHLIGTNTFSFGATTTIENIIGGDANDTLEGAAGNNDIRGGRGDDRLIYTYADNIGFADIYDGDKGNDILQINFSASEFAGSVLDDLRSFLDFIGLNADTSALNGAMYAFTSMNLMVSDFENLETFVDGILTAVPPVAPIDTDDIFLATGAVETFDGMGGVDTVNFTNSTDGVVVNLNNNTASGGFAQGDTLISIENLTGSDFADRLTGNGDNNILLGGDDVDVLIGRGGEDRLVGGEGDDTLFGDDGDDELVGNQGFNSLYGGQGNDTLTGWGGFANARYDNDPNAVNINFDTGIFEDGWGTFDTLVGIDRVFGSDFGDTLIGGTGRIRLVGGLGDDTINGGSNLDILFGNEGEDVIRGFGSKDEIFGGDNDDDIYGGDGVDKLFGEDGDDEIFGENGFDRLIGGAGFDLLDGGADKDRASYETSPDAINVDLLNGTADDGFGTTDTLVDIEFIVGSDHNDIITGDDNNNLLSGGLGIDTIDGGLGDDTIEGENGDDFLFGYAGFDRLIGGVGNDTIDTTGNSNARVSYETSTSGINVNLVGGSAQDGFGNVDTLIGVRRIEGSEHSDTINGSDERDFLYGMDDIDFINGGLGNDIIEGGDGNDRLNGNEGFDQLTGNGGADGFMFDASALDGNFDAVQDFNVAEDYLEIGSLLTGYTSGVTPIEDFVMITDDGVDSALFIDTDGGADSFTQIATLKNVTGLTDEMALLSSGALVIV